MGLWPPIADSGLRDRLLLAPEGFRAFYVAMAQSLGRRAFSEAVYERALAYPWPRPATSYLLDDGTLRELDGVQPDAWAELATTDVAGRWPLLAFGSNSAPEVLSLKLAHLPAEQRRLLVVAGDLHDFDVGAAAATAIYGSMPGTIFPSPGTVVRASLLWASAEQFEALTFTETSYAVGRLDGVRFEQHDPAAPGSAVVFAFASRWGTHHVGGAPAALAAVPARGRTAAPFTQAQLLDALAVEVIGPEATSRDLVMWLMEDFAGAVLRVLPALGATAQPFAHDAWEPFSA